MSSSAPTIWLYQPQLVRAGAGCPPPQPDRPRAGGSTGQPGAELADRPTRHPIVFSGCHPGHGGERRRPPGAEGLGQHWTTIKRGSSAAPTTTSRTPGAFPARMTCASCSAAMPATPRQRGPGHRRHPAEQIPGFTIQTSDPIVSDGQSVTISGVLDQAGTTTPEPNTQVSLWAAPRPGKFTPVADTTTGTDGSYSFDNVTSTTNSCIRCGRRWPARHTAVLFEGVQDVVTMTPSSSTSRSTGRSPSPARSCPTRPVM